MDNGGKELCFSESEFSASAVNLLLVLHKDEMNCGRSPP